MSHRRLIIAALVFIHLAVVGWTTDPPQNGKVELVPYSDIYRSNPPPDTVCPNGSFVTNLVNKDTSDHNLYVSYGTKEAHKLFSIENGLRLPLCARPEFIYATDHTIALFSGCKDTTRGLILLTLRNDTTTVKKYTPLFIDVKDSILLVQDYQVGPDKLLIIDTDNEKKQDVFLVPTIDKVTNPKQLGMDCADVIHCIQNVWYKDGSMTVKFLARFIQESSSAMHLKGFKVKWK
jgi:hypothetical protein